MNIVGMSKERILMALYKNAKPKGMGYLHYDRDHELSEDEAGQLLNQSSYFDYLHGRVMKVDLGGDELETRLYDRDNGEGAAEAAIKEHYK